VCIFKESGIAKKDFTGKHSWWQNMHVVEAATCLMTAVDP